MEVSAPEVTSEETLGKIERLLRDPPWNLHVPPALAAGFERRRAEAFGRLVGPGTPFVMLLTCGIALGGLPFFDLRLSTHDGRVWWGAEAVTACVSAVGLAMVRWPNFLARYVVVVAVGSALILGAKLFQSFAFIDRSMAAYATYVCALTTNLITLAYRLPPRVSALTCLSGGLLAALAAVALGIEIHLDHLPIYVAISTGVSLGVAHFSERQERIAYLQSLLLASESAKVKRLNEVLETIARTDPLTRVANRRHFDAQIAIEWERARREKASLSLLFVDVDHFKLFNDEFGHPEGDVCLERVASALTSVVRRPADLPARYGGEEFVMLLPNTDVAGARKLATDVLAAVDALRIPHSPRAGTPFVTVSVGIATLVPDESSVAQDLVTAADENLYRAKSEGRHRASYTPPVSPLFAR